MEKQVLMRELEEIGFILSKRKIACGARAGDSYVKFFSPCARGHKPKLLLVMALPPPFTLKVHRFNYVQA